MAVRLVDEVKRRRNRKNGGAGGEEQHGEARVSNRAETIRDACKQITELEGERKSIGEAIRAVKQTLVKGDLGMKIGDFNAALRLYKLEGDDRAEFFDTLRETFEALGIGGQLDFINALGDQPAA